MSPLGLLNLVSGLREDAQGLRLIPSGTSAGPLSFWQVKELFCELWSGRLAEPFGSWGFSEFAMPILLNLESKLGRLRFTVFSVSY